MLTVAFLMLFFTWNVSQTFKELEVKRIAVIYCVKGKHSFLYPIAGVHALMIKHFVFSVMTGLIVEMLFMLFSVYNAVQ